MSQSIPADRPFVFLNLAMSADGKIASSDRSITTFGSSRDLAHLYALRATADAILCGARTVEETGATLGNGPDPTGVITRRRKRRGLAPAPLRVVASGSGSISLQASIWKTGSAPLILLTTPRTPAGLKKRWESLGAEVWMASGRTLDFVDALRRLRQERSVRRLLCEGGGQLNAALLREDLVDEIHLTVCPLILGGRSAPTIFDGSGFERLNQATGWKQVSSRRVAQEMFLVFRRVGRPA